MNTNNPVDKLAMLVGEFGPDKVKEAAEQLLNASVKKVPAGYDSIVMPDKVQFTFNAVDAAIEDVIKAGEEVEKAYGAKASLLKQKTTLATAVELTEADALMQIRGESRSQYALVEGEKVSLTNEEMRKAYCCISSKEERKQLNEIEATLAEIDTKIFLAKEKYAAAKEAADLVKSKAHVQGNLLNFLS